MILIFYFFPLRNEEFNSKKIRREEEKKFVTDDIEKKASELLQYPT